MSDLDHDGLPDFVPTSITGAVDAAADFALKLRRAAAVTGPPGIGKSTALLRLYNENKSALYGDGRKLATHKALLNWLADQFGLFLHGGRSNESLTAIIDANIGGIVASGVFLLIDEIQDIELRTLRTIVGFSEEHRLPMVLIGNERSLRPRPRIDMATFDQILSRIAKTTRLKMPSHDDYAEYAKAAGVSDPASIEAVAFYGERTSFRHVRTLLATAIRITGAASAVNASTLRAALRFVTDDPRSAALLNPHKKAA